MAEVVRMPKLSDTMTEGVVAAWHKKVGDKVKSGELLADIETDKATMEFESFQNGVLLYIGVEKGKGAPVAFSRRHHPHGPWQQQGYQDTGRGGLFLQGQYNGRPEQILPAGEHRLRIHI